MTRMLFNLSIKGKSTVTMVLILTLSIVVRAQDTTSNSQSNTVAQSGASSLLKSATHMFTTSPTTDTVFKPSGSLWGYAFGDFYYKEHADPSGRGGTDQYSGIPAGRNAFQFRRIYLGYNYNITPTFAAEMLMAAEDDFAAGDLLANSKFTYYIKYANIRWRNIWKGSDLVIGEGATPAFPLLTEMIWGYQSVERTISDLRRVYPPLISGPPYRADLTLIKEISVMT